MGAILSDTFPALSLAVIVASALLTVGYVRYTKHTQPLPANLNTNKSRAPQQKRDSEKSLLSPTAPTPVVPVVPGGFTLDTDETASKPKKSKKKKGKKAAVADSIPTPRDNQSDASSSVAESSHKRTSSRKRQHSSNNPEQEESWTRVETRRRQQPAGTASKTAEGKLNAELTSDAGVTTSVTGNSSPVTERTEDEAEFSSGFPGASVDKSKPSPISTKTGVEDMLDTSEQPKTARVMRIQPRPDEKPVPGFSWADYEDVVAAEDADGEDDAGWGVVKSRGRSRPGLDVRQQQQQQSPRTPENKKQRQNAAKRQSQKSAKAEAEAERLAALAKHRKELEKARIAEQYKSEKTASASVDDRGHLVWD